MTSGPQTLLVADIGGTNARFAIGRAGADGAVRLSAPVVYREDSFATGQDAVRAFLRDAGARPDAASIAVAGPVRGGQARLTNRDWAFSEAGVAEASGAARALLLNDFAAAALSLPFLPDDSIVPLGGPARTPGMWRDPDLRVSALGPGTGLGHAVLLRADCGLEVLDSEGGHIGFAAWDGQTWGVVRAVTERHGRCSLEHILSGPGLRNLHAALTGDWDHGLSAKEIGAHAPETVDLFCRILGAAAGDLALATGARAAFVFGGVAGALGDALQAGGFRAMFEAKGQFTHYMRAIPTMLARSGHAGLIGAAASLVPDARSIVVADA